MKEIKRIIHKLGGKKKKTSKADQASHVVKFTAKDAQKFMAMQDSNGNISEKMYLDAHHKIVIVHEKASPSKKPAEWMISVSVRCKNLASFSRDNNTQSTHRCIHVQILCLEK